MFSKNKIIKSVSLTGAVYGFFGWFYIMLVALVHPETLPIQFTHLTPWLREDIFGMISFVVSAVCFFVWNLYKDKN
jgi:hypothetical protein